MTSGQYLKAILKKRGIVQSNAHNMVGKSKAAFQKWLSCNSVMPYSELQNLKEVFKLDTVEYLELLSAIQSEVILKWRNT